MGVCKQRQWYGCWGAWKKSKIYKNKHLQCCAEQGDVSRGEQAEEGRDEYEEEHHRGMCKPRSWLERMRGKACGDQWKKSPDGKMCCRTDPKKKQKKKVEGLKVGGNGGKQRKGGGRNQKAEGEPFSSAEQSVSTWADSQGEIFSEDDRSAQEYYDIARPQEAGTGKNRPRKPKPKKGNSWEEYAEEGSYAEGEPGEEEGECYTKTWKDFWCKSGYQSRQRAGKGGKECCPKPKKKQTKKQKNKGGGSPAEGGSSAEGGSYAEGES